MLVLIDRSAAAMSDLLDDVQTAVHLAADDVRYELETVDLPALVEEALESARHGHPERDIHVHGLDGLEVEVDRQHALHALRALLVNALRFSPDHTVVEVAARPGVNTIRLDVLDRGSGFPAADRERSAVRLR
jgi:signal transduction histidine kinase